MSEEDLCPVQGTADDAALSKVSACMKGYYQDDFIREFVGRDCKRSPLINRGYYARVASMDMLISRFLNEVKDGPHQIVSLGAGSDTTYFRLHTKEQSPTLYVEVDLPGIVHRKLDIFQRSERSRSILGVSLEDISKAKTTLQLITDKYALLKVDLRNIEEMDKILSTQVPGFDFNAENSSKVISWITSKFPVCAFMSYEQIRPNDPFGRTMIGHFKNKGCPLMAIDDYPDPPAQKKRLESLGWKFNEVYDMNDIYYKCLDKTDLQRAERLEIFDEFEEWHLMQAHYCIILGVNDTTEQPLQNVRLLK